MTGVFLSFGGIIGSDSLCTGIHGFIVLLFMSLVFKIRVNKLARVKFKVTKTDIGESTKFFFIFSMYKAFKSNV